MEKECGCVTVKKGDLRWSISPSDESKSYGDEDPVLPWLGMAMVDPIPCSNMGNRLARVNADGQPDDDPNASAWLSESDFYKTKEEATEAYIKACKDAADKYEEKAKRFRDIVRAISG